MKRKIDTKIVINCKADLREDEENFYLDLPKGIEKILKPNQKVNVEILE